MPRQPIAEGPGTVIGPYKLLEQIGEGGFGVAVPFPSLKEMADPIGDPIMSGKLIRLSESAVTLFLSTAIGLFMAGYFTGQQLERTSNTASINAAFRTGHDVAMQHMQTTIGEITKPGHKPGESHVGQSASP